MCPKSSDGRTLAFKTRDPAISVCVLESSDGRTLAFKMRGPAISVCVLNPQMVEHWLSRREVSRLFLGYSNIYSTLHYEHHLLELTRGNPRAVYRYNTLSPLWCTGGI